MKTAIALLLLSSFFNTTSFAGQKDIKFEAASLYKNAQAAAAKPKEEMLSLQQGSNDKVESIHKILQNEEGNSKGKATELGYLPQEGEKAREEQVSGLSCTKEDCNVASVLSTKAVNKRDAQLEVYGFTKDKESFPENTKGYLDQINSRAREVANNYDQITGTYQDCKPIEREFTFKEKKECDEYYDVKYNNCPISQVVEIDPKYTYQCNKKRIDVIKTCNDEIASISCKKSEECDNGGVIAASVKSDMKFVYNYPTLTIGTIADNYWRGWCQTYDRVTEFDIRNKDKITEFMLTDVGFDDYLWIQLNGENIYVGPDGGERVEVVNGRVEDGRGGRRSCERATNWHRGSLNKDLIPYLKEGKNTLFMRVVVAGAGEGWMRIRAKQHCCKDWDITWKESCSYAGGNNETM